MKAQSQDIGLENVTIDGETYFKITNHHLMRPFFMSIVSDGNHWMFISSNGGLTAGRKNSNFALFPYYTDDKLTEMAETSGCKSIFRVTKGQKNHLWEPFSIRSEKTYQFTRNLYKNTFGNKVIFEEINYDLSLAFRYQWSNSNEFGFVRKSHISNLSDEEVQVDMIDGLQNIVPHGVSEDIQAIRSNLVDAYKRSELDQSSGLGIYALSAIIVDRAEPSEALKANVVWSLGIENPNILLSSEQLADFRNGESVKTETDKKAAKGAYFLNKQLLLKGGEEHHWKIVANVNQGPSEVVELAERIKTDADLENSVENDIQQGTEQLFQLVAAADGFQLSADDRKNARHYSNTLFNIMRGGIFDHNYDVEKQDFILYIRHANASVAEKNESLLSSLDEVFSYQDLKRLAEKSEDADFARLAIEYLPLKFSRRHGDPSRPWNKFSINTTSEIDGSKILDYEGNWRDIFQNWEALAHSYPEFIDGMIFKFLNASTFDGYNPYRVTKGGFDWEVIEEHDPWSYIGYWGDHQIIYLLKFLEFMEDYFPEKLQHYFAQDLFVYANVPYKIKSYDEILKNPKDTIIFDHDADMAIREQRDQLGADGALIRNTNDRVHRVNFIEKILATVLAKVSNFIPEGGIWMNTQRPEWNDANNALVGNGVSMVTLYYLRRFLSFVSGLIANNEDSSVYAISKELKDQFNGIFTTLEKHKNQLALGLSDQSRKTILDGLGAAASHYRDQIYKSQFSGEKSEISIHDLRSFVELTLAYLDHSIKANERKDGMYHAYNLMTVESENEISIGHLEEMLEGQVAVLSSGYLSPEQALAVLDAMKKSKLFRPDQYSYLLYPNKDLPGFLEKNFIPENLVKSSKLMTTLLSDGNKEIINEDVRGQFHFNGNFNNAEVLKSALQKLPGQYQHLIEQDQHQVLAIYEKVFNHKAFTGRSGTFYGYEGLGSIYWHMVSKLLLAVEECCHQAVDSKPSEEIIGRLMEHYYEINAGIGVHKSPELYGAFPIDPYSHTPSGKGAQQPGMTGQVKEDILSRIGELGVKVKKGKIHFDPCLLQANEFLQNSDDLALRLVNQQKELLQVEKDQLAFTYCQVPVVYEKSGHHEVVLDLSNGEKVSLQGASLDSEMSQKVFHRTGEVKRIHVSVPQKALK